MTQIEIRMFPAAGAERLYCGRDVRAAARALAAGPLRRMALIGKAPRRRGRPGAPAVWLHRLYASGAIAARPCGALYGLDEAAAHMLLEAAERQAAGSLAAAV